MTPQLIANEINQLKPDLKDFWTEIANLGWEGTVTLSDNTAVNLFKFELVRIFNFIHPRFYISSPLRTVMKQYHTSLNFVHIGLNHNQLKPMLEDITSQPQLISAHVDNFKQYLNPYLRKKFGYTKSKGNTSTTLQDNEFSLELFKNSLGKRKIPSTEGLIYFKQIEDFDSEIRDKFMEVLFNHCTPSIEFLRFMYDSYKFELNNSTSNKYIAISKYDLHTITNKTKFLGTEDTFNERDSEYVPFVCGVPRKPTPVLSNVAYLFDMMHIIMSTNNPKKQYIANCIKEHLALPEYKEIMQEFINPLKEQVQQISTLIGELDG